jgi:hypothetical protein
MGVWSDEPFGNDEAAVLGASELQELWEESDDYLQWQDVTKDLLARL